MGAYEATKVVFARLQALEPNLAPNIIGMLLTKDKNEMDMIHLACGPDNLLQSIIAKVRTDLTNKPSPPMASWGFPSDIGEEASFSIDKVGCDGGEEFSSKEYDWKLPIGGNHHRSFLSSTVNTPGWKPCLYYQSGMTTHLGSDDMQEYSSRPPQIDQSDLTNNCSARQIYLTFPPDSIFSKEDVCNYFSMYGMVQDVRIPYQEKRMFGFVTFAYQKTVKLILAKGNPHYICDARVLVKPYKEKDKVPNKKFQQSDSPSYMNHNRLLYSRVPFDLRRHQIDNKLKNEFAMREIASTAISTEAKRTVISTEEGKREYGPKAATPNDACGFLESGMEYNLPHSPFSSPTKASNVAATAHTSNISSSSSPHKVASSLFLPTCTLELPPTTHASFKRQGKALTDHT
uniref:RNA recognition motif, putative n=1 Tax=Oryza sativa subsp. japonica TaxID=39947 RepID=Q2RB48_ORYSJ|nr:RNA recognition motif, putative [Oryza sativa Japonica Group]